MEDREKRAMPRLLSVNVGLPRDVAWRGKTVHTAIWKTPVQGRHVARRLNIDGDGQGDLVRHGGEPIDGLPDGEVCIGDRYRIATTVFEVTHR